MSDTEKQSIPDPLGALQKLLTEMEKAVHTLGSSMCVTKADLKQTEQRLSALIEDNKACFGFTVEVMQKDTNAISNSN